MVDVSTVALDWMGGQIMPMSDGRVVAIWADLYTETPFDPVIRLQVFGTDGEPAGSAQIVADDFTSNFDAGSIVELAGGGFAVRWTVSDPAAATFDLPGWFGTVDYVRFFDASGAATSEPIRVFPAAGVTELVLGQETYHAPTNDFDALPDGSVLLGGRFAIRPDGTVAPFATLLDYFSLTHDAVALPNGGHAVATTLSGENQTLVAFYDTEGIALGTPLVMSGRAFPGTPFFALPNGDLALFHVSTRQVELPSGIVEDRFDTWFSRIGTNRQLLDTLPLWTDSTNPYLARDMQVETVVLADGGWVVLWKQPALDGSGQALECLRFDGEGELVGASHFEPGIDLLSYAAVALPEGGFGVVLAGSVWDAEAEVHDNALYWQGFDDAGTPWADGETLILDRSDAYGPQQHGIVLWTEMVLAGASLTGDGRLAVFYGDILPDQSSGDGEVRLMQALFDIPAAPDPDPEPLVITGDETANLLLGTVSDEVIRGLGGNDTLYGDAGADTLEGGDGDDLLGDSLGPDTISGGAGTDTIDYRLGALGVVVDLEDPAANAGDAEGDVLTEIENVTGSAFSDLLSGTQDRNILSGGDGDDILSGRAGADRLDGGAGYDTAEYFDADSAVSVNLARPARNTGDAEGDTYSRIEAVSGSRFNDKLTGDARGNIIAGNDGDDLLSGGNGVDGLIGGLGVDTLVGGAGGDMLVGLDGADIFRFVALTDSKGEGLDRIEDFQRSQGDRIDLTEIDANTRTARDDAFRFIGKAAFHGKAGELRLDVGDGATAVLADVNGDRHADLTLLVFSDGLLAKDFLL